MNTWRTLCSLLLIGALGSPGAEAGKKRVPKTSEQANSLTETLLKKVDSSIRGTVGISVYSLKHNRYEVNINDTSFYSPASCLKLLVTAAAIHSFPVNSFPKTKIELKGSLKNKKFEGELKVTGGGDPNISARYFLDEGSVLDVWADSIRSLGIDTLQGDVVVSDAHFSGASKPTVWKREHFDKWFGAEVSALSYNDNCFTIKVLPGEKEYAPVIPEIKPDIGYIDTLNNAITVPGRGKNLVFILHPDSNLVILTGTMGLEAEEIRTTLPVRNPTLYFKTAFTRALERSGILLRPGTGKGKTNKTFKALTFSTVPFINIMEEINQRSQNLHAEMLLRNLGKLVKKSGTAQAGIQAEKEFLHGLGIDSSHFQIVDGSGLSHLNKVKPRAMTELLVRMARHCYADDYMQTMVTPGLHGVRSLRLRNLGEVLKVKTGYINQVQGLCGYLFSSDNDTLAFSIFFNDYSMNPRKASNFVDSLAATMAGWYNHDRRSRAMAEAFYADRDVPETYFDRLIYFSKKLEGSPYFLGPTGEGLGARIDPNPVIDITRFDCVTFIESVMALAMSKTYDTLLSSLTRIRYFDYPPSYLTRKHFFVEDWIGKSPGYVKPFRFPGDTTLSRTTGKKRFFKMKQLDYPKKDPTTPLSYLPYGKALKMVETWTYGKRFLGVAFVTEEIDWLWVTHTGFLDATGKGPPLLRHASSTGGQVLTENFSDYLLRRKGKCAGVFFFEFENRPVL
ncbi:D-alanyl-D-alanine carboxypeptidase/D-alanyl-D-alanine-endopeptidase [Fibrobacterota bacterium]